MFTVTYEDKTTYSGKSYDGSWKRDHESPIVQMYYHYTYSTKLMMRGYASYNHLVEKEARIGSNEATITKILVMGRKQTTTDVFVIDLKVRNVTHKEVLLGQEYNGQELAGWKKGVLNNPGWDVGKDPFTGDAPLKWER